MMPPFVVFPTNRIAHFVEVSLYLLYLAQQVKLMTLTMLPGLPLPRKTVSVEKMENPTVWEWHPPWISAS